MGRRKGALDESAPYYELAQWLRSVRKSAGLTYRKMAEKITETGYSPVTLSRSDGGWFLPRREVVLAYAGACGASRREAHRMWWRAAADGDVPGTRSKTRDRAEPRYPGGPVRRIELIYEPAHLLEAMNQLRMSAGLPSLRVLQGVARAGGFGPLPRSTLAEVLAGVRLPSEALLISYVRSCGEPPEQVGKWRGAWQRAQDHAAASGSARLCRAGLSAMTAHRPMPAWAKAAAWRAQGPA